MFTRIMEKKDKILEMADKKRVKLDRAVSVNIEKEPLTFRRYKTASPSLRARWRSFRIEEGSQDPAGPLHDSTCSFECMKHGESPPPDDMVYFESLEDVSRAETGVVTVCKETLRKNIYELMKSTVGNDRTLDGIEDGTINAGNVSAILQNAVLMEKNVALLWAALLKKKELLEELLKCGADLHYSDPVDGFSALHLSAFSGCLQCCQLLISRGASVNLSRKLFSPLHSAAFGNSFEVAKFLINNGAKVDSRNVSGDIVSGSPLYSAVKANAVECVRLLISELADVNLLGPCGLTPLHLAADLGHIECLKALLGSGRCDVNLITADERKSTALHLAAEGGYHEEISLLLLSGADLSARNVKGQTALHLAAKSQCIECIEILLKTEGCDVNVVDFDYRTPLHCAVSRTLLAFDIVEVLISWRADVNAKDKYGYTPLHIAAHNELSQCVETLIYHGADVSARTKGGTTALGIIVRKTPASLNMMYQKLDAAITLHNMDSPNRELELKMDFRILLQNCHKGEISFLKTFVDEGQKEILEHPLCEAFLHLKWEKIRKYYVARLIFYCIFILSLSVYVLTALSHNCYNEIKAGKNATGLCESDAMMGKFLMKHPFIMEVQWFVLVSIMIIEICRKVFGIPGYKYSSAGNYFMQVDNLVEWFVIASVFLISFIYTNHTYTWQNHVAAFAVLCGWTNLMVMIGQLPKLGSYVAMYTSVQTEFMKLLAAYSCLLIGFAISFCVIFPTSSAFANPLISLIKVLVMMTGEMDFGDLLLEKTEENKPSLLLEVSAQVTFVLFLLFVTIILMNLLVGIAVHDIQGLQKSAGLSKLVRQTKLISYTELALFCGYLPPQFLNILQWTALLSPSAYRVVLHVKPLNPKERRLPVDILQKAYEVARAQKKFGHTISSRGSSTATTNTYIRHRSSVQLPDQTANVLNLCSVVDDNSNTVKLLTQEVKDLREILNRNENMLKSLLEVMNRRCSDC